ncbi:hypothetical protein EOM81_01645 [bacterium]|nr:hypothetical protein [bacterium]
MKKKMTIKIWKSYAIEVEEDDNLEQVAIDFYEGMSANTIPLEEGIDCIDVETVDGESPNGDA